MKKQIISFSLTVCVFKLCPRLLILAPPPVTSVHVYNLACSSDFTTFSSSFLITSSYHLRPATSLIFSAVSTTSHLLLNSSLLYLTSSPSFLLTMSPYHLSLAPSLIVSAITTTSHLLNFSLYYISDQFSFISSYYKSISFQPCHLSTTPHLLLNYSFYNNSDQLSFISYYLSIITRPYHLNLTSSSLKYQPPHTTDLNRLESYLTSSSDLLY